MLIAPSILTANFAKLEEELIKIETADKIHLDVMDGHFVPNISFGPHIARSISKVSKLPLDIHLMVTDPLFWIDQFVFSNTEYLTIHVEANDVKETIKKIKQANVKVGISLKPKTKVYDIIPYLSQCDLVLVMTVEPGFGGQSFMTEMMDKVVELVKLREEKGLDFLIEVDGGISDQTIDICKKSGVDMAVAGSYIFNHKDPIEAIKSLK
ncbi:MAG: ribulose-phosphate 3-epimerase [Acholeplasmataceae bacterium]|nr:ribulose-phosphate 3-epimerase [Acholeplasmataceae bacterium]